MKCTPALCLSAGFVPKVAHEVSNTDSIFGLVAAGMGITIYPDCNLNYNRPDVVILPLANNQTQMRTEMTWLAQSTNQAVFRFVDSAKQLIQNSDDRAAQAAV